MQINVNGRAVDVADQPDEPLLWVLRDELKLTGTRFGCGVGICGACTVLLDGVAARACQVPLGAVGAQAITTIEGLGGPDGTHPLQQAFIAEQVPQCGYCMSGQIMNAAGLLNQNPQPSDAEIIAAMDGNICRCGTYVRIKRAIRRAAAQ